LFGPFEAWVESAPLPPFRTRKGQWLLALLAIRHGAAVDRDWLAGTLWPESSQSAALANLRRSLTDLRQRLGSQAARLTATPHTLCLDLAGAAVDLLTFDAALHQEAAASLETAIALYRGPLLEGCVEEWVLAERQAREEAYLRALECLSEQAARAGDWEVAARHLRRAVAVDPLRETAQRALMAALAASGNYAAATMAYRDLRLRLHRELHVEPDPATRALFEQLRAESRRAASPRAEWKRGGTVARRPSSPPGSPAPPSGRFPHPLTHLVGREREAQQVREALAKTRLVTLTGAGGVGKTRLAIRVAGAAAAQFTHGAWFVDLAGLRDARLVPQAFAAALRVDQTANQPLPALLVERLEAQRLLLVVDNCEHLLAATASLIATLLTACPSLQVLATSRRALGITGEFDWRVPSLRETEAVALFIQRAEAVQPRFALTETTAAAVTEVCRRLDGIPLAIELAAARLKILSAEQIAARLAGRVGERFRLLTGGSRAAVPRQQTLRATMDWSCQLLKAPERALLACLSVFAGSWSLEAAESVGGSEPDPHDRLELLTALADQSLVVVEDRGGEARYRLLETTREYAHELLAAAGELGSARARHLTYFLGIAEAAAVNLGGAEQSAWIRRLEADHDNLRAALEFCLAGGGDSDVALRLTAALWRFWAVRGHLHAGRMFLAAALDLPGAGPPGLARLHALQGAGNLARLQGDRPRAREYFAESLAIARAIGNRRLTAQALGSLALVIHDQADYAEASSLYGECLALCRSIDDLRGIAGSLANLASVASDQGDDAAARPLYEESLARWRELGDRQVLATVLSNLGPLAARQGDLQAALGFLRECLTLCSELGDRRNTAFALEGMAVCLARRGGPGDAAGAAQLLGAAEALRQATGILRPPVDGERHERLVESVGAELGAGAFTAAHSVGREATVEWAIALALELSAGAAAPAR
jgi:non-specific serine/threonine protein kinase